MNCIYCGADVTATKKKYHVAPQASGNTVKYRGLLGEIVLPPGLRCDECNEYFGSKVEPGIANHPYVQQ